MNNLFNSNNPFFSSMETLFDIFILNTLWLICCLPIVTIGPATASLYYAMMNRMDRGDHYVSRDFFGYFKANFRQTVKIGLPLTALNLFLIADIRLCYRAGTGIYTFFMVFFAIIFVLAFTMTLYTFALLSQFKKSTMEILPWAFILSIRHFAKSILMLFTVAAGLWVCHILPGLILISFGLIASCHALIFLSILKPYLPDPESDTAEGTTEDTADTEKTM